MNLTEEQIEEFQKLSKQLIKWLNDNCNPHTVILIEVDSAEILSGEVYFRTEEFIKD